MERITYKERENIERLIKSMGKVKYRAIGRAMWKSHTTIRYEILHHSWASWYNADIAQWIYERNQQNKGNVLKAEHLKTLTFDRWTEWAMHEKLAKELWLKVYFCHAYSSWEKWAVENRNMFIREYLPRNTIIADVSDAKIYEIQETLNNRPMKCLWYRTPNEMMFYEIFWRFPNPLQDIIFPHYEM